VTRPARNYIIAGTPRTGSSLLCEGLEKTGVAGRPAEVFAPDFRAPWFQRLGLPPDAPFSDYFAAARRHGTGPNGVYGVKIQHMHVRTLASFVGFAGDPDDVLELLFPEARYISIVRRDRRAQALSWFRAIQTNEWARTRAAAGEPATPPEFDEASVKALERAAAEQQGHWDRYFATRGIEPLVVEYESLAASYCNEIARVLAFLRLDDSVAHLIPAPWLTRQADEVTRRWRMQMDGASEPA
jgi:LPS sulfotransferase NodH